VKKKNDVSGINSSGKEYFMCSRDSCGFWKWADDIGPGSGSGSGSVVPAKRTFPRVGIFDQFTDMKCSYHLPFHSLLSCDLGKQ
jgi:hypothetical protein